MHAAGLPIQLRPGKHVPGPGLQPSTAPLRIPVVPARGPEDRPGRTRSRNRKRRPRRARAVFLQGAGSDDAGDPEVGARAYREYRVRIGEHAAGEQVPDCQVVQVQGRAHEHRDLDAIGARALRGSRARAGRRSAQGFSPIPTAIHSASESAWAAPRTCLNTGRHPRSTPWCA